MKSAFVIGEALIDVVGGGDGAEPVEHVGGSPANVALGLARLGVPVRLRTALARDARGERVVDRLSAGGVLVESESFVLDRTPTAGVTVDDWGAARYDFDIEWRIESPPELGDAAIVHVGSIAAFLEPGGSSVIDFLWSECRDVLVTLDPNIRPALLSDGTRTGDARVRERFFELLSLADVVKLSDEDAAWLLPELAEGEGEEEEVLERLLSADEVALVVLTHGADGITVATRSRTVHEPAVRRSVRDTIGAGDAVTSALLAALLETLTTAYPEAPPARAIHHPRELLAALNAEQLRRIAQGCSAAAGVAVSRPGADPPTGEELAEALVPFASRETRRD